jgi:hypothetical protein
MLKPDLIFSLAQVAATFGLDGEVLGAVTGESQAVLREQLAELLRDGFLRSTEISLMPSIRSGTAHSRGQVRRPARARDNRRRWAGASPRRVRQFAVPRSTRARPAA